MPDVNENKPVMERQLFSNNAQATLKTELKVIGTSIEVDTGQGALFPIPGNSEYFLLTVENPSTKEFEILKCFARDEDRISVLRAQEGTIPRKFPVGSRVELRVTKGTLESLRNIATNALQHFKYEQDTPSDKWTINHGLSKFPSLKIFEGTGDNLEEVIGKVVYKSADVVELSFTSPVRGVCYLN